METCQVDDGDDELLSYVPGTKTCKIDKEYEMELLSNITKYGLWNYLPIYADYVPIRDIISNEKQRWVEKYGSNESLVNFPSYIVTNHFGSYCIFSRDFFPIYFDVASYYGLNRILFVLLESKSPWYFSTRQSVTGIPDIRLYKIDLSGNKGYLSLGQYITSGQRSYEGFKYWLERYTKFDNINNYPLLISKPILHKNVFKNEKYYLDNYQFINAASFYQFNSLNSNKTKNSKLLNRNHSIQMQLSSLVQASSIIENECIAYISTLLTLLLIIVTLIQWISPCCKRLLKWYKRT